MVSTANLEDLNSYEDLLEHFSNSLLIVDHYNTLKKEKSNLETILKKLAEDVENLQTSEKNLTDQLHAITETNQMQNCINDLYQKLKENYSELETKYTNSLNDNDILQKKSLQDIRELQERNQLQQNTIIDDFTKKLKFVEVQLEQERNHFLQRESQLYNEVQLAQASNALQYDETEAKIESLHLQLRDAIASHNTLRQEYLNLKTQSQYELETAKKCINDLECKLRITEKQLRLNQEQLFNYKPKSPEASILEHASEVTENKKPVMNENFSFSISSKYDALDLNTSVSSKSKKKHELSNTHVATIKNTTKALLSIGNPKTNAKKSYLPALKQLSKPGQKPAMPKKRKLYKPGAIDFQDFEEIS